MRGKNRNLDTEEAEERKRVRVFQSLDCSSVPDCAGFWRLENLFGSKLWEVSPFSPPLPLNLSVAFFYFIFSRTEPKKRTPRLRCDFCSFVADPHLIFCRSGDRIKSRIARGKRFRCRELETLHLASRWLRRIQLDAFDSIRLKEVEQGERWWRWAEVMVGWGRGELERGQKEASLLLEVMDVTAISSFKYLKRLVFSYTTPV